jgi:hypothetical protein
VIKKALTEVIWKERVCGGTRGIVCEGYLTGVLQASWSSLGQVFIPLSDILLFLYYLSIETAVCYILHMPWVKIDMRKNMIAPRMEVTANAIIKITKNSFVVAITGGTLDSMTFNLIMGSLLSRIIKCNVEKDKHIIVFSILHPYYTS